VQERRERQQQEDERQRQQQQAAQLAAVQQEAAATIFALLQDCVAVQAARSEWLLSVPAGHPFLRPAPEGGGVRCVAVPLPRLPEEL
jgi:hypothetical protein